ncbi:hypothetical protein A2U01_0078876 [Trifolium medium]|uniref:Uncharacterized protein n=1 Tax=Trifolium medium TaxID=97028 RepID=A0A392TCE7_9FABA|nr:hypothetical protein [Trifolium medium]
MDRPPATNAVVLSHNTSLIHWGNPLQDGLWDRCDDRGRDRPTQLEATDPNSKRK